MSLIIFYLSEIYFPKSKNKLPGLPESLKNKGKLQLLNCLKGA